MKASGILTAVRFKHEFNQLGPLLNAGTVIIVIMIIIIIKLDPYRD